MRLFPKQKINAPPFNPLPSNGDAEIDGDNDCYKGQGDEEKIFKMNQWGGQCPQHLRRGGRDADEHQASPHKLTSVQKEINETCRTPPHVISKKKGMFRRKISKLSSKKKKKLRPGPLRRDDSHEDGNEKGKVEEKRDLSIYKDKTSFVPIEQVQTLETVASSFSEHAITLANPINDDSVRYQSFGSNSISFTEAPSVKPSKRRSKTNDSVSTSDDGYNALRVQGMPIYPHSSQYPQHYMQYPQQYPDYSNQQYQHFTPNAYPNAQRYHTQSSHNHHHFEHPDYQRHRPQPTSSRSHVQQQFSRPQGHSFSSDNRHAKQPSRCGKHNPVAYNTLSAPRSPAPPPVCGLKLNIATRFMDSVRSRIADCIAPTLPVSPSGIPYNGNNINASHNTQFDDMSLYDDFHQRRVSKTDATPLTRNTAGRSNISGGTSTHDSSQFVGLNPGPASGYCYPSFCNIPPPPPRASPPPVKNNIIVAIQDQDDVSTITSNYSRRLYQEANHNCLMDDEDDDSENDECEAVCDSQRSLIDDTSDISETEDDGASLQQNLHTECRDDVVETVKKKRDLMKEQKMSRMMAVEEEEEHHMNSYSSASSVTDEGRDQNEGFTPKVLHPLEEGPVEDI